jgi:hypothetical protein
MGDGAAGIAVTIKKNFSAGRESSQKVRKGALDVGQIAENVCVIKIDGINYQGIRHIVDKLASLIKKSRIILVSLNDKRGIRIP